MFVNIDLFVENAGHSAHNVSGDGPLEFALPAGWVEARVMSASPMQIQALMGVSGSDRTLALGIGKLLDGNMMLTIPHGGILGPAVGLRFEVLKPPPAPSPSPITSYSEQRAVEVARDEKPPPKFGPADGPIWLAILEHENGISGGLLSGIHLEEADALEFADRIYRLCGVEPPARKPEPDDD